MNHIYIIGNGFDISHGLPTRYSEFIIWYMWKKCCEICDTSQVFGVKYDDGLISYYWDRPVSISSTSTAKFSSTSDLRTRLKKYTDQKFLSIKYSPFLKTIIGEVWWVDIEKIYYETLQKVAVNGHGNNYTAKSVNAGIDTIKKYLRLYLEGEVKTKLLKQSLKENLKKIFNESTESPKDKKVIVNFNYTSTIERYDHFLPKAEFFYLHGNISKGEEMLFGYGNESDSRYQIIEGIGDNSYLQHMKSIQYTFNEKHGNLFTILNSKEFKVHMIGHSLGEPDWTFLSTVLESPNCKKVELHFYKDGDFDNFSDLSINISRILSPKTKRKHTGLVVPKTQTISMS